jgi:hypothetical protein
MIDGFIKFNVVVLFYCCNLVSCMIIVSFFSSFCFSPLWRMKIFISKSTSFLVSITDSQSLFYVSIKSLTAESGTNIARRDWKQVKIRSSTWIMCIRDLWRENKYDSPTTSVSVVFMRVYCTWRGGHLLSHPGTSKVKTT